ncbi:hypothetical protein ACE0DR_04615 [Azotobacter sp. CWF10]
MFGFGLNALDIISFYYLFVPTWIFTIIVYTLMAKRYGAAEQYPEEEAELLAFEKKVEAFQAEQAKAYKMPVKDNTTFSKWLHIVARASLTITLLLAGNTMFFSPDMATYEENRGTFYNVGFACTVIYFAAAYWAMRRRKALTEAQELGQPVLL